MGIMSPMDTETMLRRLVLNLNASVILTRVCPGDDELLLPSTAQVNKAVKTAREIEKAVRKRLEWEARRDKRKGGGRRRRRRQNKPQDDQPQYHPPPYPPPST